MIRIMKPIDGKRTAVSLLTLLVLLALAGCRGALETGGQGPADPARLPRPLPAPARHSGQHTDAISVFEEARRVAVGSGDAYRASGVLLDISRFLDDAGLHAPAKEVLDDVAKKAEGIEDVKKREDRLSFARFQAVRAGEIEPAIAYLQSSPGDPDFMATKLGGETLWTRTPWSSDRGFLLQGVLDALVARGDREQARVILQQAGGDDDSRSQQMALALARSGSGIEALEMLKGIRGKAGPFSKTLISQLPLIQAQGGDIAGAVATARAIEDEVVRYTALLDVAKERIKRNDPVGAVEMVTREVDPFPASRPAVPMSPSPAKSAWYCVVRTVGDAVDLLAERGFPAEARQLLAPYAHLLTDQSVAMRLATISLAHHARGETALARTAAQESLAAAEKVGSIGSVGAFLYVGKALAAAGDLDGALARLEASISQYPEFNAGRETYRIEVKTAHVWGRLMAGASEEAGGALAELLREVETSATPGARVDVRQTLVQNLLRAGRIDEALALARAEQVLHSQAWLLAWAARTMLDLWPEPGLAQKTHR